MHKITAGITRKLISTPLAAKPVAPYNQAVLVDKTLYVSGVLGLDKDSMKLVDGGIGPETRQLFNNLEYILQAGGSSFSQVVKVTILLKDIADFGQVNEIYSEFFTKDYPARVAYQAGALPLGASIEMECIAISGLLLTEGGTAGCQSCGPSNCACKM